MAETGDRFIITKGDLAGAKGSTNSLKIVSVGHELTP
jgi:pyruvate kinase